MFELLNLFAADQDKNDVGNVSLLVERIRTGLAEITLLTSFSNAGKANSYRINSDRRHKQESNSH